ncbi:MAG: hypothetical protein Tsb0034_29390 [Ekhidna sp.]
MRIGQLARKYDLQVQEIIDYLEEETGEKFHPNAKLYDTMEANVLKHFDVYPEELVPTEEDTIEDKESEVEPPAPKSKPLPETPEDDIALAEGELAYDENSLQETPIPKPEKDVAKEKKPLPKEDEVIQTDKLLEMLESEEPPADLEKIKLIKAPKRALSGLKVVGKVDLPEPKKKEEKPKEKDTVTEKDLREYRHPKRKKRPPLSEEEKEKRRLKAKAKQEAYEARQEKRRKEQEAQKLKALKEAHYKQNLQKTEVKKQKQKGKALPSSETVTKQHEKPKPKTALGKFWRWLNT